MLLKNVSNPIERSSILLLSDGKQSPAEKDNHLPSIKGAQS
jgi:hypothetical protein